MNSGGEREGTRLVESPYRIFLCRFDNQHQQPNIILKPFHTALLLFAASLWTSSASVVFVAGNDTLVANRSANLPLNGSFEADGGLTANTSYWAIGTGLTPTMSLTSWTASGQVASYAIWGNDRLGGIKGSAPLPHGTSGLYFGAGIMALVAPWPLEAPDGEASFGSPLALLSNPSTGPVTLRQAVTGLNPSTICLLDFWTSGENVGTPEFPVDGFFGLEITGESRLYLAAPSGNGPTGNSQRYQVYFNPASSTVTFEWIDWGHYVGPNRRSDELVLDDVILNEVPEPSSLALLCTFGPMCWWRCTTRTRQPCRA
jgi:hypothetical protein